MFRLSERAPARRPSRHPFDLTACAGRLVEVSSTEGAALLTSTCRLVLEAQQNGDHVAWISLGRSTWFAPDVADVGIDLDALIVIRVASVIDAARAAEELIRANAFGLVVIDLGAGARADRPPAAALTRLSGLALRHDLPIVFLTHARPDAASLSSLISLRVAAENESCGGGQYRTRLHVVKDKRYGPGAVVDEVCDGPAGLS